MITAAALLLWLADLLEFAASVTRGAAKALVLTGTDVSIAEELFVGAVLVATGRTRAAVVALSLVRILKLYGSGAISEWAKLSAASD